MRLLSLKLFLLFIFLLFPPITSADQKLDIKNLKIHKEPKKVIDIVFRNQEDLTVSLEDFKDKLVVAGYHGLKLYKIEKDYSLTLLDSFEAEFEATPFVYNERIYIASRNGYLYCFGN